MKFFSVIAISVMLLCVLLPGCTSTSPQIPVQTPGTIPPAVQTTEPVPACCDTTQPPDIAPYPQALPLNSYANFGSGEMTGKAAVLRYRIKPGYNWTAPSFNSPREQAAASGPFDIEHGYNTEKPHAGNTFLFVTIRVDNTGNKAVYAPSAKQFVVSIDGRMYSYSSVHSSDVTVDTIPGTQYDYQIGRGGEVGYVQPGESNAAEGYLIYEIPAQFSPEKTYVVSNLDYQTQAVWKLA